MNYSSMTKKQLIQELCGRDDYIRDLECKQTSAEPNNSTARRLSKLIGNLPGGIIIETSDRTICEVNTVFCSMFGIAYSPDALKGLDCKKAARQSKHLFRDETQFLCRIETILSEGKPVYNEEIVLKDGRVFERDYIPIQIESKRVEHLWHYRDITDRKKDQEALFEKEKMYRHLVETIHDVIFQTDIDGIITYVSPVMKTWSGYSNSEVVGRPFMDFIHPDDLEGLVESFKRTISNNYEPWEFRIRTANGQYRWVRTSSTTIIEDGNVVGISGVLTDITDRIITEHALKESELNYRNLYTLFRTISDNMTDMLWAKDLNKKYLFANKAICMNLLNARNPEEVIGKTDLYFAERTRAERPDDPNWHTFGEICRDSDQVVIDSGKSEQFDEFGNVRGKFLFLDVHKSPLFNDKGEMIGVVGSGRDVTQEKEIQRRLEESEQKYRHIIQHSGDAIYLLYNRRFEIINEEFTRLFGVTLDDINSDDYDFINLVAPQSRTLVENRIRGRNQGDKLESKYEFTALDVHGREIEVEASVTHIRYKDGMATQGIIRDITERKRLERQLRHAQKMEAVGQLAGGVAHDFNNLLTVISGYCDLLLLKKPPSELAASIKQIRRAGERAESLVSQLLAYSRKQIIQPKTINLNELVNEYSSILARLLGEDIEISTILDPNLKSIHIDPGQMEQIIMNISVNARDAMPNGGRLNIETTNVEFDQTMLETHGGSPPGNYIMLAISDTGIGMDETTKNRMFEPFYTTKERDKGTGLGLSSVYGIVKQNQGLIQVSSESQKGTTFRIYLPAVVDPHDTGDGDKQTHSVEQGLETILLVEDDTSVRDVTKAALTVYGYTVIDASNGEEALRIFLNREDNIDLLLTDVVMPRMSGNKLARLLREREPDLKVLFFSGYTDDAMVQRGIENDGMDYIQKPYSHVNLSRKIREVLDRDSS